MQNMDGSSLPGMANIQAPGTQSATNSASKKPLLTAKALRLTTKQPCRAEYPTVRATELTYLIFERPDLDLTARFLADFGLRVAARQPDLLFMRGTGSAPFCYVVLRGPKARFVGLGFSVATLEDLNRLAAYADASPVEEVAWPGGGKRVRMTDPAGFRVDAICGQGVAEVLPHRAAIKMNTPDDIVRIDGTQRPPLTPPEITKLGHVLLEVPNYQDVCGWYTGRFGLIPSDICVIPDGSPAAAFFRLDLGDQPADHHTLALTINFVAGYGHSAFEVVDADAVGVGQRILQKKGWRHAWGIGRHILGSQIFDYWEDPWGSKHEHYCDGDVFTAGAPTEVHAVSRDAMAQWGPKMPKRFTRPSLGLKSLLALVRNLFACEDLSVKKLITLLRLVA
jgi:catechol 2,3-dioxygenase-like lactoylglutathione lyase family enzyme